jgi:tryptophan-rich sensory protein
MRTGGALRGALDDLANSRGRTTRHLLIGLGVTGLAVGASALAGWRSAPTEANRERLAAYEALDQPAITPPKPVFSLVWPPLFLALTLSGLRIWNAPASPRRTRALVLWGAVQALNAAWMILGPRRLGGQLAAAVASFGTSGAYVWQARQVDAPAGAMVTPYLGWVGFANVLTEELWRKNPQSRTLH